MSSNETWKLCTLLLIALTLLVGSVPLEAQKCGPIDFVLVLDDTASMDTALNSIQMQATQWVDDVENNSGGDFRLALVTFKDSVEVDLAFTRDRAEFERALQSVVVSGGGGTPEASDRALDTVNNFLAPDDFRPTATKIVVLVTDAPPGGPDGVFQVGDDDVAAAIEAQEARSQGILISAVHIPNPGHASFVSHTRDVMQKYASITGGEFVETNETGTNAGSVIRNIVFNCGGGCARTRTGQLLCTTDDSGDYEWSFVFFNLSDEPVQHLFFLDPTGNLTFEPDHVEFPVAIPAGYNGGKHVGPIRIQGAAPGPISFLLTVHDREIEECCSTRITLELPECDCGQIPSSRPPSCFTFGGGSGNPRIDQPEFQSLFDEPVSHLLLSPISPEGITLTPSQINLTNDPLTFGDSKALSVRISGGEPGDEVCYRISTHNEFFDECCSIERCVHLRSCEVDPVGTFGSVTTRIIDDGFLIEGFPAPMSGETGGIVVDGEGADAWDAVWAPVPVAELMPGAFFRKSFLASVENEPSQLVAVLESTEVDGGIELRASFPALEVTTQSVELYRRGVLVDRLSDVPVGEPVRPIFSFLPQLETDAHYTFLGGRGGGSTPIEQSGGTSCDPDTVLPEDPPCLSAGYTFDVISPLMFPFSAALADEVRFFPEGLDRNVGPLEEVRIEAAGLPSLLIESMNLGFDCNGNGVRDFQDLINDTSLDLNSNGVPDECDGGGVADMLRLNTGFDETSDRVLPLGAVDADWNVVTVGESARVVQNRFRTWVEPLPDSEWISVDSNQGRSVPGTRFLDFERCFCLREGSGQVSLALELFADDRATVFLNGTAIGGPGGKFNEPAPLEVELAEPLGTGLFQPGENCLTIEVDDVGGVVTGLDLAGSVGADDGFCL